MDGERFSSETGSRDPLPLDPLRYPGYPAAMMKILGITAHPDDEVGAFGGTLLHYNSLGVETYVICLTRGEAATNRGRAQSHEELAAIRSAEFFASCKVLKVTKAQILKYPDGGLNRQDFHSVTEDLIRRIREIAPDVILTMGPEGSVTGHPDHSMVSIFATMAFHWAPRNDRFPAPLHGGQLLPRPRKLYYSTASFVLPDRPPVSPPPWSATIEISPFLEEKIKASREHATQAPLMERFAHAMRRHGRTELFHLAAADRPGVMPAETDLLAGLE